MAKESTLEGTMGHFGMNRHLSKHTDQGQGRDRKEDCNQKLFCELCGFRFAFTLAFFATQVATEGQIFNSMKLATVTETAVRRRTTPLKVSSNTVITNLTSRMNKIESTSTLLGSSKVNFKGNARV